MSTVDKVVSEFDYLSEKAQELGAKTRKLILTLDTQTKILRDSSNKIKELLGVELSLCSICMRELPNYCVDQCHHVFCRSCSNRALRAQKCHTCRSPVVSIFKIYI